MSEALQLEPTRLGDVDGLASRVADRAPAWAALDTTARARLLDRCLERIVRVAPDWVARAVESKRSPDVDGEEWLSGPTTTARGFRLYAEALRAGGEPHAAVSRRPDGRAVARIFPSGALESLLYFGIEGELWIRPGQEPTQGGLYRAMREGGAQPSGCCLVLGAGNVSSIGPLDVLHKLLIDNETVVLKMSPVNDYLAPVFESAMAPLIEEGFLAIATGGVEVGAALTDHPRIDSIHLTGSEATHDAIVWGTGPDVAARKKRGELRIDKRVTSELGCVTPILVVPGPWTDRELDFQARHVASMVAHNASFNCNAAKVVVTAGAWDQRETFLSRLRLALDTTPTRHAYYPGAAERHAGFLERYPQAEARGAAGDHHLHWTLIPDVPAAAGEYALQHEAFCGVLADVALPAAGPEAFLEQAVAFVNTRVRGTLSCALLIDDATRKGSAAAVDRAIGDLRYGGVCLNVWPGVQFFLGTPSWGAYPGHTLADVGSGIGVVHNTMMFDHPEKTVLEAPFRLWPKPVWFSDHRTLARLGRRLTRYEAHPSSLRLPAIGLAALTG